VLHERNGKAPHTEKIIKGIKEGRKEPLTNQADVERVENIEVSHRNNSRVATADIRDARRPSETSAKLGTWFEGSGRLFLVLGAKFAGEASLGASNFQAVHFT
jgi:hypothetical protein